MNITIFGATDLTFTVLEFLEKNSYTINAIITVPEIFNISYNSNGVKNSRFVDLHPWAYARNIPVITYKNVTQTIHELMQLQFKQDFALVVGWYHMIPKKLRDCFHKGCAGFHASLLPKLRGGAPLNWAILLDHKQTGVSFFELSDGVDDGLLYDQDHFDIEPEDDISCLIKKSETSILKMIENNFIKIASGNSILYEQQGKPSYCGQRIFEDSLIQWEKDTESALRLIKATTRPYAGAFTFLDDLKVIIWRAEIASIELYGSPGQIFIIDNDIYVTFRIGALKIIDSSHLHILLKSNQKRFKITEILI